MSSGCSSDFERIRLFSLPSVNKKVDLAAQSKHGVIVSRSDGDFVLTIETTYRDSLVEHYFLETMMLYVRPSLKTEVKHLLFRKFLFINFCSLSRSGISPSILLNTPPFGIPLMGIVYSSLYKNYFRDYQMEDSFHLQRNI